MKRSNHTRTRTLVRPIKIELSEAEIMADLQYPVTNRRPDVSRPSHRRNLAR